MKKFVLIMLAFMASFSVYAQEVNTNNNEEILETLEYAEKNKNNIELIDKILEKARPKKTETGTVCSGLTHREASVLLACDIPEKIEEIYKGRRLRGPQLFHLVLLPRLQCRCRRARAPQGRGDQKLQIQLCLPS